MRSRLSLVFALAAVAIVCTHAQGPNPAPPSGPVTVVKKLIDSPLDDIQWADSTTVFVVSEQGVLYRSSDGGKSWTNQSPKLHAATSTPVVRSIHISPVDPRKIFIMGQGSENWMTTDMGKTYNPTQNLDLHEVKLHPTQSSWLLGGSMSAGCQHEPKKNCYKVMHVSKNFGQTWAEAVTYVVQFDWAPPIGGNKPRTTANHDEIEKTTFTDAKATHADELVYATIHHAKHGNQKFGMWDANINMYESYDYFKTQVDLVKHGNRFLFGEHGYLFIAAVNPHRESEVSLKVSKDDGTVTPHRIHNFKTALLPVELTEHSYTILDTSEGTVFLHVNHQPFDMNAPTGHVYISDWSGVQYSLSLPYNHRSGDGKCDFEKVEGLEGIYLANFIDETDKDDGETFQGDTGGRRRPKAKTVITFDKGGIWSYLEHPQVDSNGKKIECTSKECHLHLHGITDLYGPFYSSATATGLIMATGTIGSYLAENIDKINTYLSRDAGLTWFEVAKGSHIYEFGDHGGLIVMAYDEGETDVVLYSWDQGITWKSLKISDSPIQVENIIIEPEATSQQFVVYGWQEDSGVMVYLDFGELHERDCQGADAADSAASDYESWTPSDGRLGPKCLMGHKVSYTRRKRDAQCFNPEQHERTTFVEHCPCTEEDFECDYGYYRKLEGGPCIRDPDVAHLEPVPPKHCPHKYYVTKGYRRVAGDTCIGGEQWDRIEHSCPGWFGGSHFGKGVLVLLIVVVAGLAFSTFYNKSEFLEDCVDGIRNKVYGPRYWEIGKGKVPHSMADDDFGVDDQEYGQSSHLIGSDKNDDEESEFKPLPAGKARAGKAVPKLSGPADDTDDFDPRGSS